jgi:hypothetical protein
MGPQAQERRSLPVPWPPAVVLTAKASVGMIPHLAACALTLRSLLHA